jgi:SAM-dependent methyltransferase
MADILYGTGSERNRLVTAVSLRACAGRGSVAGVTDYLDMNRASWDERAPAHAASPDYAVERFVADPEFLSEVVRFDLPLLGDVRGARGVHLQCHIGTDTISLARLGADMTGLDFSGAALAEARRISERAQTPVEFVESTVYDALTVLQPGGYDLVFTGIGALCWLPDVARWAGVVAGLLRPGGRLFIREGHPMMWAIDESHTDALVVGYPYFEVPEPIVDDEGGTYVETDVVFTHNDSQCWNHGIGEIITAVMDAGMELTSFVEHESVPWDALPGQMERDERGEWHLVDQPSRLALTYTLQATRSG